MLTELESLPKKITPCPIAEAAVELRFNSAVDPDAIFGIVYQNFREDYSEKVEKLPILQLPVPILSIDPKLKYQPYYKLNAGNLILQIGPKIISLSNIDPYLGWERFSLKIKEVFLKFEKLKIIKNIERLGIRYINFFKLNIFDHINLAILMNDKPLITLKTNLKTEINEDGFLRILQIANDAKIGIKSQPVTGSIIDINIVLQNIGGDFFHEMDNNLEKGHTIEKKLFFGLLKKEFLDTLNPEY